MADIINFEPIGGVSPGYAYQAVEALINASWNKGLDKEAALSARIADATSGFLDTTAAPSVTAGSVSVPTVSAPTVDIPASANVGDVMSVFDTKYLELVDLLTERFDDFRLKFFPNESDAYEAAETWLKDAIQSETGGVPDAVMESLLESERSRVLDDASRASDAVLATFAARRFAVPPGAALGAVAMIQQKAQGEIAEGARKLTALSVDMQKFNIEKLLGLRQSAMGAAVDYVKALASGPDMATKLVSVGYDAQSKLIAAAADFYRADVASAELTSKVGQFNQSLSLEAATKNQASELALIEDKLKALLAETQAIAQMATSLFNNLNVSVGASGS